MYHIKRRYFNWSNWLVYASVSTSRLLNEKKYAWSLIVKFLSAIESIRHAILETIFSRSKQNNGLSEDVTVSYVTMKFRKVAKQVVFLCIYRTRSKLLKWMRWPSSTNAFHCRTMKREWVKDTEVRMSGKMFSIKAIYLIFYFLCVCVIFSIHSFHLCRSIQFPLNWPLDQSFCLNKVFARVLHRRYNFLLFTIVVCPSFIQTERFYCFLFARINFCHYKWKTIKSTHMQRITRTQP